MKCQIVLPETVKRKYSNPWGSFPSLAHSGMRGQGIKIH